MVAAAAENGLSTPFVFVVPHFYHMLKDFANSAAFDVLPSDMTIDILYNFLSVWHSQLAHPYQA